MPVASSFSSQTTTTWLIDAEGGKGAALDAGASDALGPGVAEAPRRGVRAGVGVGLADVEVITKSVIPTTNAPTASRLPVTFGISQGRTSTDERSRERPVFAAADGIGRERDNASRIGGMVEASHRRTGAR